MSAERRADLAYFTGIAFGLVFVVLGGPLGRRLEMAHFNDFSGFWAAGRAVVLGVDPYDPAQWGRIASQVGWTAPTSDTSVPNYMPWAMLLLAAIALLPVDVAAWLWMIVGVAAATFGLRALLRAYLPGRVVLHAILGLALFLAQPTYHALVLGQWSPLLLGALATCVLGLRAASAPRAALPTALFFMKPQLFVFTGLGLLYGALRAPGYRHAAVLAAALAAVMVAVGWAAFPGWLAPWLSEIPGVRTARSAVLPSAGNELLGTAGRVLAYVLILAGAVVASRFRAGSDAALAAWISLSAAGAIYAWSYDQVLLFVPVVIAAGVLVRAGRDRHARALVIGAALTLIVISPVLYLYGVNRHDETFSIVVPVAAFVAIVALLWPLRASGEGEAIGAASVG